MKRSNLLVVIGAAAFLVAAAIVVAGVTGPNPPDPKQVAAGALGVEPTDVQVAEVKRRAGGREEEAHTVVQTQGGPERVWVRYDAQDGALLRVVWPDRGPDSKAAIEVTQEEAERTAQEMMSRLFPQVPVEMALVEARMHDQTPQYSFGWSGAVGPDTVSGDHVLVSISAVTGQPVAYLQRVARLRPNTDEISISKDQAIAKAIEATEQRWREQFQRRVTVNVTEATLWLSSPISAGYGPVWLVTAEVNDAESSELVELTSRAIDAMTGELLQ